MVIPAPTRRRVLQLQRPGLPPAGAARAQRLREDEELGSNMALDFSEFLFESIETGLDRFLICEVASEQSVQESLVGDSAFLR